LALEHRLSAYKALERVSLKTKQFDFDASIDEFYKYKDNTSQPVTYHDGMRDFWLPFFLKEKGCTHPSEFIQYRQAAIQHVRSKLCQRDGKPISFHSYNNFSKILNQYVQFLNETNAIGSQSVFKIWITATKEEIKRGKLKRKRSTRTYDLQELIEIKKKIDRTYAKNPKRLTKAYGYYFGVITGQRQGNVLGFKAEDLFPEATIPHFRVSDNIVSGYSRGQRGYIIFENATKTTTQEDDEILLPLIQPSRGIAVEVARHLKNSYKPKERICLGTPHTFYRTWKRIAKDCGFTFLNPHNWKHTYATIGGEHLEEWYNGRADLLQMCCLHESLSMTEKYIKKRYTKRLQAWTPKT